MEPSFIRDTLLFIVLSAVGVVGVGVLIAFIRGQSPLTYLLDLWTDPSWMFICVVLVIIWFRMYPKFRRSYDRQMN